MIDPSIPSHYLKSSLFSEPLEEIDAVATELAQFDLSLLPGLTPLKVRVVASFTSTYMIDILRLALLRRGFAATIEEASYGTFMAELMAPGGPMRDWSDLNLVLPSHRDVQFAPPVGATEAEAKAAEAREADFWTRLLSPIVKPTVLLGFDTPRFRILAERDGTSPGGLTRHVRQLNADLSHRLQGTTVMVDAEALQTRIGLAQWHDERLYQLCKQPFAMEAIPEIAATLAATAAGLMGKARKVLVLDLDNTLWGGVIGDVGMDQIEIGPETAEGEAFTAFQRYCKALMQRGVILAICSKNHDEFAREPFRSHPAMVLREDDIACFVANFDDKAGNIRKIARTLNLGLESIVFVDDNPVERELVAFELPEVLVVDLDEDPALYAASVEAAKAFPLAALTQEDLGRARSYRAIAEINAAADDSTDLEGFLERLEPRLSIEPVAVSAARIAQLLAKTNQFKLNPQLFTESEILDAAPRVLALRLTDRLQDYGIVAVVVMERAGPRLTIANWVMSCRVFSRRLEHATMELILDAAKAAGASELGLAYVPSKKNIGIPAVLAELGFTPSDQRPGLFVRTVAEPLGHPGHFMTVTDRR